MMASRSECHLHCPDNDDIQSFLRAGINVMALACPDAMKTACGYIAEDGRFEHDPRSEKWFAFEEFGAGDIIFWRRATDTLTSFYGWAFALGEDRITEPGAYSFDCALNIFAGPLEWLRAKRDGIVVLPDKWPFAFDRLRDCPRIAIAEQLLPAYRSYMKPLRMPELLVIPAAKRAA
ncbi:hypothetical protein [Mesorhizobium sp.]|uniref:hypothetical protein n=1 Tax=Mesorhizobium sp. TaxID=1871066 RepID=UPI000FEA123B|nr:hypothetical protein [Mesorhizobium sp.]RWP04750.1 MAG: hypothetical protein EOQ99_17355 [Mesorhizobium sp.]TIL30989.1 MAG: hypothetical protein E5Y82_31050 [Mesorhizobium sp.]TIL81273.1 MAG: hypothetical protein E5Y81_03430 [Mesorhizobium sp.]TIM42907.1 MAG: hypothetical protein E5Y55_21065 [Mesorhizobium sp.]